MCGKPLEDEPAAEFSSPKKDSSAAPEAQTETSERAPERPVPAPAYTGGIFNLGAPSESSGSADYLLEDDEPRSGKGLLLLGLVAVALVVGLGWMRFRQTGLPGLKGLIGSSSSVKPSASTDAPAPSQTPTDGPSGAPASSTPNAPEQPPASGTDQTSTPAASAPPQSDASASQPPAGTATPPPAAAPSNPSAPDGDSHGGAAAQAAAPDQAAAKPEEHASEGSPAGAPEATPPPPASPVKPAPTATADTPDVPEKPKKLPKPTPSKPEDTVALGEKYLYGRGVPQSCEKGLRYVKPAAEQSNPKAMITMGALYATGHCLSRDLPTAYRYFALALRQDPGNGPLKQNAEMVWGQMTQSERQLAIKLTQ
jgi:hypothetical protein